MPIVFTLCGARWILLHEVKLATGCAGHSSLWRFSGAGQWQSLSLLTLGNMKDAQHSRAPHLVGGASGVQRPFCLQYGCPCFFAQGPALCSWASPVVQTHQPWGCGYSLWEGGLFPFFLAQAKTRISLGNKDLLPIKQPRAGRRPTSAQQKPSKGTAALP